MKNDIKMWIASAIYAIAMLVIISIMISLVL